MTDESKRTGRGARPTDAESISRRRKLDEWQRTHADQTVGEILRYRDYRGLTNDQLRDRLRRLGWDLTRDSLASILAGKRKSMPVPDVLLFAQALNVPPIALVFPVWTNQPTKLSPDDPAARNAYDDARWFFGTNPYPGVVFVGEDPGAYIDEYYDVGDIIARLEELESDLRNADNLNRALLTQSDDDDKTLELRSGLREAFQEIASSRRYLQRVYRGIQLPPLPESLNFLDEREPGVPDLPIADPAHLDELPSGLAEKGKPKRREV